LATRPFRPLSVLYVAEAFGGGLFEITRMKAEGLARLGHRTAVAYGVRPETPENVRDVVDPAVELIPMPWTERTIAAQLRSAIALRRLCRAWKPDVVHLVSSFAGLHGAVALDGFLTVYTPQGYAFTMSSESRMKRYAYLAVEDFVARRVDVVAACSLSEGEQARSLPGADVVAVVPNGIQELDRAAGAPAPPRAHPVVSAMGRPSPQRQPEACARILSALGDRARGRWIGGGPESPGRAALQDAGVSLTGWLPRAQTLASLGASSVYLHWTAWDGLPLSILEAMARDVVVVASDIGPNREILGPRQVCRTEDDAVRLVLAVLEDPDLREQLLADQRERRRWYGADRMVARWIDLYGAMTGITGIAAPAPSRGSHERGVPAWH
jgi:glycosyltransferase involved in cell wall biosynthesis